MNMINGKKIHLTILSALLILFLAFFGYFFIKSTISMDAGAGSKAVYSLAPQTTLTLDGPWKAYSDSRLTEEADIKAGVFSTGSYYLSMTLHTEGMKGGNAFLINPVYSAYKLWINGELVAQAGEPGGLSEKLPLFRSRTLPYEQKTDDLEIVFQVSNFSHTYGGNEMNWIAYGRYEDVIYREQQGKAFDFLIIFGLFSFGLIHLFNYHYQRKYLYSMFFFLYMYIYAVYALFTGRVTAAYLIPVMTGGFILRTEAFLLILALPVILNYIKALLPDEIHRNVIKAMQIIVLPLAVLVYSLPLPMVRLISLYYGFVRVAGAVYILVRMISAIKAGRFQAKLTLVSFLILVVCVMNDLLYQNGIINSIQLLWPGIFIFAAQQTYRLMVDSLADYREFESTLIRLSNLTNQKESFFSRNSIELDKPIRNIVELGESLLKGSIGPLNSEQIATSSLIVSNGVRLTNMVNDILDFSRIKENSIELNMVAADFFKISRKVINSCEALVVLRKVVLNSAVERDNSLVLADERRIEQILYNIISNSIRHVETGSITVSSEKTDSVLEITISVRGSDLNEDNVKTLFSAYDAGVNEGIDEQNASDLSLAIAKKLIELHDQEIHLETRDDMLVYTFSLANWTGEQPVTEEEALEIDALINLQPVFDEITSDRNIEILIAGKDVEELQILKSQLSSMNYSVIPLMSGADLLSRVKDCVPQLIVVDVKLPDMSGYEVCNKLRKFYSKDELPIILVINREDITEVMEGLTSGANDFLTRPYMQEEFLTRVNTHLQLSRISHVYSRFVPTEFLASLGQKNILDVELGDQVSREMTILFVDIRAFTNLSENLTPEENFKFINSYLSRFSPMITDNGGFVDKYIGDAIMALFPDKPENALAAAREMIEHVKVYNGHRANCGYKPIDIGIGIHTGNMILGIIGDEKRMQGTVISDAVNLASRIQDVTKLYKANIVISQETFVKLENPVDYSFRFLGRVKVKGKDKAVALFEIFDSDDEERRKIKNDTKVNFEEAIMKFSRRNFDDAKKLLQKVLDSDPEDLTASIFIERIDEMKWAEKRDFLTSL